MAPIVNSIEISRRPEEVFEYLTDPSHLPEWQESVVSVQGEPPYTVGSKVTITRRVGPMERTMPNELTELTPPSSWAVQTPSGPIRGGASGRVEPLEDRPALARHDRG
jgi:Polyketide cyclase / dehydrase and lipid transport